MKEKFKRAYMETAQTFSKLSYARRLQVGAVIVKNDSIISYGYNGMPAEWDNNCEDREYMSIDAGGWFSPDEIDLMWPYEDEEGRYKLVTKPEVLHAEMNSLMKLAKSNMSGDQAFMFITHAPCLECAKGIHQAGIKSVFYREEYRSTSGIEFLNKCGISVEKVTTNE